MMRENNAMTKLFKVSQKLEVLTLQIDQSPGVGTAVVIKKLCDIVKTNTSMRSEITEQVKKAGISVSDF